MRQLKPKQSATIIKAPEQIVEDYLNSSRIIKYYPDLESLDGINYINDAEYDDKIDNILLEKIKARTIIRHALLRRIQENDNKFPSREEIETTEQFFWNISHRLEKSLLKTLFETKIPNTWQDFIEFSTPFSTRYLLRGYLKHEMGALLSVYLKLPKPTAIQDFMAFCTPFIEGVGDLFKYIE